MKIDFTLPAQNVPLQLPSGEINPVWYDKLKTLERFFALFSTVDFPAFPPIPKPPTIPPTRPARPATLKIANGQVLVWDDTNKLFRPANN
jgi:hypothetical protein